MSIVCPKCRLERPDNATTPIWQCPGCGVAYNKSADASSRHLQSARGRSRYQPHAQFADGKLSWLQSLLACALLMGGYVGYRISTERGWIGDGMGILASRMSRNDSPEHLAALATRTQAGDIFVFSAEWCPNCREAKRWMERHGFAYQQCDIDRDHGCQARLASLGGKGIPYLIVKGRHMREGFDSEEFVAALRDGERGRSMGSQGAGL